MRATVDIPDALLREAQERAKRSGVSLDKFVEGALRTFLAAQAVDRSS